MLTALASGEVMLGTGSVAVAGPLIAAGKIKPIAMAKRDMVRIKAGDGLDIPVHLTRPPGREGPAPMVVLVHGGPWVRGGEWRWDPDSQFLASRGYVVVEPEFRGSMGFGFKHFQASWKQWGLAMQDDVADAVRWAAASQRVDGRRVCIIGGSYGGYATLMGLVRDPDVYRCGVAWAAVSEPLRLLESSWWWADDIDDDVRRHELPRLLGDPKQDAEMLKAISPVQQAARIRAPLLLVHGDRDVRVPLVHAKAMREALQRHGQEPEWLSFPDEGHSWRKVETQRAFARRLETFLDQHLK